MTSNADNRRTSTRQHRPDASRPPRDGGEAGRWPSALPRPLRTALLATAVALLLIIGGGPLVLSDVESITTLFFRNDVVWLALAAIALIGVRVAPAAPFWARWSRAALAHRRITTIVIAGALAATALTATYVVYHGYALSRDEAMAEFDAMILREGKLLAPVAPEWRPFAGALEPEFRLPIPGDEAWVSSYLPGNALLRATFSHIGTPALTGPLLAGLAVVALMGIARRLWPERPDAALVAGVLLATTPQVLFMAMTPYAMTAHLALNLVWLWLFLRDDRLGHAAAIAVGFFACGLHQVIFHPLFVAPFVLQLWLARRWRPAAFYTLAYGLIGVFWILYWQWALALAGIAPAAGADVGAGFFMRRVAGLIGNVSWSGADLMAKNLVRFVAFETPITIPLALLAAGTVWRSRGPMRPIAAGIPLIVVTMLVILPEQVHGWGYRYLHGLIGNLCLLAAQGWIAVTERAAPQGRTAAWSAFAWVCVFTLVVLVPGRAREIHRFVSPYADAVAAIRRSPADVVIVNSTGLSFGIDLVRNDPFLRGKPKVLAFEALDEPLLRSLCTRFRVAMFTKEDGAAFGIATYEADYDPADRPGLRSLMQELSCGEPFGGR